MAVTRYQFRLSIYLATVVITALVAASPRLIEWMVRGRPREDVFVELDGKLSRPSTPGPGLPVRSIPRTVRSILRFIDRKKPPVDENPKTWHFVAVDAQLP